MVLLLKILCITCGLCVLFFFFPVAKVSGNSMLPSLHDGNLCLCSRIFKVKPGRMYIFHREDNLVIKRLKYITEDGNCYFLGDNPDESLDSRDYGLVKEENIVAKVLCVALMQKDIEENIEV